MHAPFEGMHQEPKTKMPPNTSGGIISRRLASEHFVPRIERLSAQGTVASPARLPDLTGIRSLLMLSSHYNSIPDSLYVAGHKRSIGLSGGI